MSTRMIVSFIDIKSLASGRRFRKDGERHFSARGGS
jgi:hypothetical protein